MSGCSEIFDDIRACRFYSPTPKSLEGLGNSKCIRTLRNNGEKNTIS